MTDRLMIAYGLMILMAVTLAGALWWNMYHSHRRVHARRMARERQIEMRTAAPPGTPDGL